MEVEILNVEKNRVDYKAHRVQTLDEAADMFIADENRLFGRFAETDRAHYGNFINLFTNNRNGRSEMFLVREQK